MVVALTIAVIWRLANVTGPEAERLAAQGQLVVAALQFVVAVGLAGITAYYAYVTRRILESNEALFSESVRARVDASTPVSLIRFTDVVVGGTLGDAYGGHALNGPRRLSEVELAVAQYSLVILFSASNSGPGPAVLQVPNQLGTLEPWPGPNRTFVIDPGASHQLGFRFELPASRWLGFVDGREHRGTEGDSWRFKFSFECPPRAARRRTSTSGKVESNPSSSSRGCCTSGPETTWSSTARPCARSNESTVPRRLVRSPNGDCSACSGSSAQTSFRAASPTHRESPAQATSFVNVVDALVIGANTGAAVLWVKSEPALRRSPQRTTGPASRCDLYRCSSCCHPYAKSFLRWCSTAELG